MTERTKEVVVIIDHHTGDLHGNSWFVSEDHAIIDIQNRGYRYDAMVNPLMPATLIYQTDRDNDPVPAKPRPAARIVQALLDDLTDRRGLKWEWDKIDDDVKSEIIGAWERIVENTK